MNRQKNQAILPYKHSHTDAYGKEEYITCLNSIHKASHYSHGIMTMTVSGLADPTAEEIVELQNSMEGKDHWMGLPVARSSGGIF